MAVTNHLCEHFAHSRQELYHLVRLHGIQSFDAIDRPPRPRARLRDLQAGGGVDPRLDLERARPRRPKHLRAAGHQRPLPGQHPARRHLLGGAARAGRRDHARSADRSRARSPSSYGLYSKITGAQRVDLFGARLEQLPAIWRDLIAAGFESGHAYGKALRTVKSCVGSTWCRYGVQDSVSFAVRLENRYKGLRSPHKLKSAVSGCARECAEAQGKDFGIIATEKGYNLYLCGNGGMKPQHAQLFATDLDEDDADPVPRPLPDVLRPHRRPPAAHGGLVQQPRGRHRVPAPGADRRLARDLRRARGGHGAHRRHLPVRVEGRRRGSRQARALPHLRELLRSPTRAWFVPPARPAPAGDLGGEGSQMLVAAEEVE